MIQSLTLNSRIQAFIKLGKVMGQAAESYTLPDNSFAKEYPGLYDSLQTANNQNPWFTPLNIAFALNAWKDTLDRKSVV